MMKTSKLLQFFSIAMLAGLLCVPLAGCSGQGENEPVGVEESEVEVEDAEADVEDEALGDEGVVESEEEGI